MNEDPKPSSPQGQIDSKPSFHEGQSNIKTFHYVKMGTEGMVKSIGIEADGANTAFVNAGNMAFIGVVARHQAYRDLKVLADALIQGGCPVEGYETLVKDLERSRVSLEEYERESREQ